MQSITISIHTDNDDDLREENAQLRSQLPEGMKHCTIEHKECPKGHSWLTATNWVPIECPTCKAHKLQEELNRATKFKQYVHNRLDQQGVPVGDASNSHQQAGCRVGARLDILFNELNELRRLQGN